MTRLLFALTVPLLIALPTFSTAPAAAHDTPVAHAAASTRILCVNLNGSRYVRRNAPSRCASFGPGEAFAGGVDLKGIRWSGWGTSRARGRGIECGFRADCHDIKVSIVADRPRRGCGGVRVYTRLRATSTHGTATVRLKTCPKDVY